MQHKALAGVEADPHRPLLPRHPPTVDMKAWTFGGDDLDGLQTGPEFGERGPIVRVEHELLGVVARGRRQRHHTVILDVGDLHDVEVEDRDDALDGTGVAVLGGCGPHEGERAADLRGVLVAVPLPVVTRGPGVDHGEVEIDDAPPQHRLLPTWVGADGRLHGGKLVDGVPREPAGDRCPRLDDTGRDVHDRLVEHPHRGVVCRHECPARDGLPRVERQGRPLVRLGKLDRDESRCASEVLVACQDRRGGLDLGAVQRIQRVSDDATGPCGRIAD